MTLLSGRLVESSGCKFAMRKVTQSGPGGADLMGFRGYAQNRKTNGSIVGEIWNKQSLRVISGGFGFAAMCMRLILTLKPT